MTKSEGNNSTVLMPNTAERNTLTALYTPLTNATVQTRRDTDRITFQYIAIFVAIITVLASEQFELIRTVYTQVGATIVVASILFVALYTLCRRAAIYNLLFENLVRIESALGAFCPEAKNAYDPAGKLREYTLLPDAWSTRKPEFATHHHLPHAFGLALIAIVTVAAIWAF